MKKDKIKKSKKYVQKRCFGLKGHLIIILNKILKNQNFKSDGKVLSSLKVKKKKLPIGQEKKEANCEKIAGYFGEREGIHYAKPTTKAISMQGSQPTKKMPHAGK